MDGEKVSQSGEAATVDYLYEWMAHLHMLYSRNIHS